MHDNASPLGIRSEENQVGSCLPAHALADPKPVGVCVVVGVTGGLQPNVRDGFA